MVRLNRRTNAIPQHLELDRQLRDLTAQHSALSEAWKVEYQAVTEALIVVDLSRITGRPTADGACDDLRNRLIRIESTWAQMQRVATEHRRLIEQRSNLGVVPVDSEKMATMAEQSLAKEAAVVAGMERLRAQVIAACGAFSVGT